MPDQTPYMKREIDEMIKDVRESQTRIELGLEVVSAKLDFTNGKVRKIILGMVALTAFGIGAGINSGNLGLLLKLIGI